MKTLFSKTNIKQFLARSSITIVFAVLVATMVGGCVTGQRTSMLFFRLSLEAPPDARFRVTYYLEHKETNPSTGRTSFVLKGQREVRMPSGVPSLYQWDAIIRQYQGGLWQSRARVTFRPPAGRDEIYVGEATQQIRLPFELSGATDEVRRFEFALTHDPTSQNPSGFRVSAR